MELSDRNEPAEANDFMKTKTKKTAKRASGSLQPDCSAAEFTPATRGELMLLSYGVEECERGLCKTASQLRHITAALAEIIHKTKPQKRMRQRRAC